MSNGAIKSSQITASSTLPPYGPSMARLNSNAAWCASNGQPGQYIQVRYMVKDICFVCVGKKLSRHETIQPVLVKRFKRSGPFKRKRLSVT